MFFVFFFKQKTAYEVRISDWSSDVCSSDLQGLRAGLPVRGDVDPVCPGRQARQIVTATGRAGAAAGQPGGQVGGGDGGATGGGRVGGDLAADGGCGGLSEGLRGRQQHAAGQRAGKKRAVVYEGTEGGRQDVSHTGSRNSSGVGREVSVQG